MQVAVIVGSKLKILKANHNYRTRLERFAKAVIVGSKLKILKANHNSEFPKIMCTGAVIVGSKLKILKANHNIRSFVLCLCPAVIVGSKLKILKANHNIRSFVLCLCPAVIVGSKLKILKANHNNTRARALSCGCYRWLKVKNSESKSQPNRFPTPLQPGCYRTDEGCLLKMMKAYVSDKRKAYALYYGLRWRPRY